MIATLAGKENSYQKNTGEKGPKEKRKKVKNN
jgi:hypothetical protein